jgi:hypothetical protein
MIALLLRAIELSHFSGPFHPNQRLKIMMEQKAWEKEVGLG